MPIPSGMVFATQDASFVPGRSQLTVSECSHRGIRGISRRKNRAMATLMGYTRARIVPGQSAGIVVICGSQISLSKNRAKRQKNPKSLQRNELRRTPRLGGTPIALIGGVGPRDLLVKSLARLCTTGHSIGPYRT